MLLSIIIPTKNRYSTLFKVVELLTSFNENDEMEIVIQDNSDNNSEAITFFSGYSQHNNIRYFHSPERLSVIENSDLAVLNSSGEYVCFIGDDDAVMPNIISVVRWMKKNNFKALKSYEPNYYWPNLKSNYLSADDSGVFRYKKWKKSSFEVISTSAALSYTIARGAVLIDKLPCLYHGIVERNVLDKIYQKAASYFPGASPDMANSIALTQLIDSYVLVSYPVTISGKSTNSAGGAGVLHQHVAKIEDVAHLPKDTAEKWDSRIPKYWTGPTIYAETAIKALQVFNDVDSLKQFNFDYLYAYISIFNRRQNHIIFKDFHFENPLRVFFFKLVILAKRIRIFISNRNGSVKTESQLKDIGEAVSFASKL